MTTWTVPATVLRVVDGDTLDVDLDLGWHITYRAKIRLAYCNAPEMSTEEGKSARNFTIAALGWRQDGTPPQVTVTSHSLDKYGRVLGSVTWKNTAGEWVDLATTLIAAGRAVSA